MLGLQLKTYFQAIKTHIDYRWYSWKFKRLDQRAQERAYIDFILSQDMKKLHILRNLNYPLNQEIEYHIGYVSMEPILIAAQLGKKEVFDFLLKYGANLNSFDRNGRNTLLFAILFQSPHSLDFIEYLLKKEVDIHHRDFDYKNALCYIKRAKSPLELYSLLRSYNANIRQEIEKNKTYIDFVLNYLQWHHKKGLFLLSPKDTHKYEDFVKILNLILPELTLTELQGVVNRLHTKRLRVEENIAQTIVAVYENLLLRNIEVKTESEGTGESGNDTQSSQVPGDNKSKKRVNKI